MDNSYIKLYRMLIKKPIWLNSTPEHKSILITLLLLANHEPAEWEWMGEKFNVNPGQFVTSLESIRKKTGKGISIQNIRSCLKRLTKLHFATNKATKAGRLITIINWGSYQPKNKKATKIATIEQQSSNKAATPNKNDKNDKNDNKEKKKTLKKLDFTDYLQDKIIENNLFENKDKIFEFYKYRMETKIKNKKQPYNTEYGIDGLIKSLNGCRDAGMFISECIDKAMQNEWLKPDPSYFKNNKPNNNFPSRSDKNKQACQEFINGAGNER
jgi:hypothetical protein